MTTTAHEEPTIRPVLRRESRVVGFEGGAEMSVGDTVGIGANIVVVKVDRNVLIGEVVVPG